MKSTTVILSLLASTALAQPHKQAHRHQHKRDQAIKWVTEWAVETEVVAVTETIWVSEGFVPPTTSTKSSTTTRNAPAQFFQPATRSKSSTSPSSTSSIYVPPPPPVAKPEPSTTTTTTPAPAPQPTEQAKAPEPVTTSTTTTTPPPAPVQEQVQPTTTSVYVPPAPPSSQTPAQSSPPSSGGGSGGECSKGSPCSGDMTHYDAGLGACGWTSDGDSSNVVALSHVLMGTQSNGNPYCGRKITVTLNGKSVVAEVVDKCMGCEEHAVDLSNAAFKSLEDMGVGRTQVSWYFSD